MKKIFVLALWLAAFPAYAADSIPTSSLFFTDEDAVRIEKLAEARMPDQANPSDIHLGAVFFYASNDWTIWLQNRRWGPDSDEADLHVISVAPEEVKLSWTSAAKDAPREIILHPHQTFQTATGSVIEGMR